MIVKALKLCLSTITTTMKTAIADLDISPALLIQAEFERK